MSATDTQRRDTIVDDPQAAPSGPQATARRGLRPLFVFPLTVRILAINIMALGVLVAGFFYLDHLQRDLMDAKLDALAREATLLAAALGESGAAAGGVSEAGLDRAAGRDPGAPPESLGRYQRFAVRLRRLARRRLAALADGDGPFGRTAAARG